MHIKEINDHTCWTCSGCCPSRCCPRSCCQSKGCCSSRSRLTLGCCLLSCCLWMGNCRQVVVYWWYDSHLVAACGLGTAFELFHYPKKYGIKSSPDFVLLSYLLEFFILFLLTIVHLFVPQVLTFCKIKEWFQRNEKMIFLGYFFTCICINYMNLMNMYIHFDF